MSLITDAGFRLHQRQHLGRVQRAQSPAPLLLTAGSLPRRLRTGHRNSS
jgi:hypothetical protein